MTGFARTEGEADGISWVWELKSVNGRSLDLRLRLPPGFDALEPPLRAALAPALPPRQRLGEPVGEPDCAADDSHQPRDAGPDRRPDARRWRRRSRRRRRGSTGCSGCAAIIETVEDEPEPIVEARRAAVLAGWAQALDAPGRGARRGRRAARRGAGRTARRAGRARRGGGGLAPRRSRRRSAPGSKRCSPSSPGSRRPSRRSASRRNWRCSSPAPMSARNSTGCAPISRRPAICWSSGERGRPAARFPVPGAEPRSQHAVLEIGRYRADPHRPGAEGCDRAVPRAGAEPRMSATDIRPRSRRRIPRLRSAAAVCCLCSPRPRGPARRRSRGACCERDPTLSLSVSVTTRPPRPGEIDGRDYRLHRRRRASTRWSAAGRAARARDRVRQLLRHAAPADRGGARRRPRHRHRHRLAGHAAAQPERCRERSRHGLRPAAEHRGA